VYLISEKLLFIVESEYL